jgi:hypothetical protein
MRLLKPELLTASLNFKQNYIFNVNPIDEAQMQLL